MVPGGGPSDQALRELAGWYAIALRLGVALTYTVIRHLGMSRIDWRSK